ncbi:bifunctional pyr operon transcriptional regulator/uracil phosphoribosyltransferase PyrR [candidate division KSB1 bacterium]|nr:bifunctional pyr operon transcriptional regulator/uracil phosphoribosyltransferase PyrR [candidate division KSB1 bacterium]
MKEKSEIMDGQAIGRTLLRLTHEILEKNRGAENLVIVGIRDRGDILAYRIIQQIAEIEKKEVALGVLDITLYRDDFRRGNDIPVVRETEIPFDITGKRVVLVDDVLYTGRTIRAALDAINDFGRPAIIQLAVLVDRGHRELPIKADYVGKNVPTAQNEQIQVQLEEVDGTDRICLIEM